MGKQHVILGGWASNILHYKNAALRDAFLVRCKSSAALSRFPINLCTTNKSNIYRFLAHTLILSGKLQLASVLNTYSNAPKQLSYPNAIHATHNNERTGGEIIIWTNLFSFSFFFFVFFLDIIKDCRIRTYPRAWSVHISASPSPSRRQISGIKW